MSFVALSSIRAIVLEYGFDVERASSDHISLLALDLSDADRYDLGRTWRNDWRGELEASFFHSSDCFLMRSRDVLSSAGGFIIFGLTAAPDGSAQIWLLQSVTFMTASVMRHGLSWGLKFSTMTRDVIGVFLLSYRLVFNFISSCQSDNIRWLRHCGFSFYGRTDLDTDMLFFGQGLDVESFASSPDLWRSYLGEHMMRR